MFGTVAVPVWLLVLILGFAGVSFATHFLFPSVRWFFRRRAEKALSRLNARLDRKIDLFKLAQRSDMVARLAYDQKVVEAAMAHAAETGVPGEVAFEEARRYAREIVPGFSATVYFGFGTRAAKWLSRLLFRVRVGKVDKELGHLDPKATVVFVMNHRSNLDYVLVTWLVADRSAISYAVGEWARVWPLSALIRSMGAYFIRRGSRNALYRKVLARYVQMATEEGTTQAMFPEGGLSLDGRVGPAKLGLISYIVEGWEPGERDVVFVPVGLAYDRVLETGCWSRRRRPGRGGSAIGRSWWRGMRSGSCGSGSGGRRRALARRRRGLGLRCLAGASGCGRNGRGFGRAADGGDLRRWCRSCRCRWWRGRWGDGARASREELIASGVEGFDCTADRGRGGCRSCRRRVWRVTVEEGLTPLIRRGLVTEGIAAGAAKSVRCWRFYAASVPEP